MPAWFLCVGRLGQLHRLPRWCAFVFSVTLLFSLIVFVCRRVRLSVHQLGHNDAVLARYLLHGLRHKLHCVSVGYARPAPAVRSLPQCPSGTYALFAVRLLVLRLSVMVSSLPVSVCHRQTAQRVPSDTSVPFANQAPIACTPGTYSSGYVPRSTLRRLRDANMTSLAQWPVRMHQLPRWLCVPTQFINCSCCPARTQSAAAPRAQAARGLPVSVHHVIDGSTVHIGHLLCRRPGMYCCCLCCDCARLIALVDVLHVVSALILRRS